jgi:hypothetical protein
MRGRLWIIVIAALAVVFVHACSPKYSTVFFNHYAFNSALRPRVVEWYMETSGSRAIRAAGVKRLAVTSFQVEFITRTRADERAYLLEKDAAAIEEGRIAYHLNELESIGLGNIADDAYRALVEQLKSRGYDVVSAQEVSNAEAYRQLKGSGQSRRGASTLEPKLGTSVTYAPAGLSVYEAEGDGADSEWNRGREAALMGKLGLDAIVTVHITVGAVKPDDRGAIFPNDNFYLTFAAGETYCLVHTAERRVTGAYFLERPMMTDVNVVTEVTETTGVVDKVTDGIVSFFSMFLGVTTGTHREYEAAVNLEGYERTARVHLGVLGEMMAGSLPAPRENNAQQDHIYLRGSAAYGVVGHETD